MKAYFQKLRAEAFAPTRAEDGEVGYDLYAVNLVVIPPSYRKVVLTGLALKIPEGYYGRVIPRSDLAIKNGIGVLSEIIDSESRGELGIILINLTPPETRKDSSTLAYRGLFGPANSFSIRPGDKIARLVIEKFYDVEWQEVAEDFSE